VLADWINPDYGSGFYSKMNENALFKAFFCCRYYGCMPLTGLVFQWKLWVLGIINRENFILAYFYKMLMGHLGVRQAEGVWT